MIVGLGIDIIDNRRIANTLKKFGLKFKKRCFLKNEIKKSEKRIKQINFFAKRYAAKEACAKALGTGLAKGVFWKDIEVFNDHNGKPFIKLHNKALNLLNKNFNFPCKIELSLSDEKNYSIANVTIFKHEK
tara:strand:+ start:68 stop:460 length:393 start_codon:yes stop_codon:yes gene_type:complete